MCANECRPADGFGPYPRLQDIRSAVGQPADQMPSGAQPFDWDFLLDYILDPDEHVIPVVGQELLWVTSDGGQIPLEQYLARALVGALGVDPNGLPDPPGLSDAVLHCLDALGTQQRPRIYAKLKVLAKDPGLPIPEALRQLAEITNFQLFLSVTFDPLLRRALDEVRFGGAAHTRSLAYAPAAQPEDLPGRIADLTAPHVFHLFGLAGTTPDYAVTDEDHLEFVYSLQSEPRPEGLFDELRDSHLLILGCGFEDWLERFLVRVLATRRLRDARNTAAFIAEGRLHREQRLVVFLQHCGTYLFQAGDPVQFVDELYHRWQARRPAVPAPAATPQAQAGQMEPGSLFVSFANEDREAARTLKAGLEQAGLDVWLDEYELAPGIDWEPYIRRNIARCAVFIPLLSRRAQQKKVGYFRFEWREAIQRDGCMAASRRFIQPVVLDDLGPGAGDIPDLFWQRQASRFPDGRPSAEFVDQLRDLVRQARLEGAQRT